MAQIKTGGDGGGRSEPKKYDTRVDFTPMVDMMLLLLTFFMFVTTLSKPQIMDIAMPSDAEIMEDETPKVKESRAITLLLGEEDKVYYYLGKLMRVRIATTRPLRRPPTLRTSNEGLRAILLERNMEAVNKMRDLKLERLERGDQMPVEEFNERSNEIKGDIDALTVVIKPLQASNYRNLVDALDEMQICSVGKYAIVDPTEGDLFLVENYRTRGAFGEANLAPQTP